MISAKVDCSGMLDAMGDFAKLTRKDMQVEMRAQAGMLIGHVIALTPPGGGKGQAMSIQGGVNISAKQHGEKSIAADIARIFPTTKASEAEVRGWIKNGVKVSIGSNKRAVLVKDIAFSIAKMKQVHQLARNPRSGRVTVAGGDNCAFTTSALLKQYTKIEQAKAGKLAAGWLAAADELRTSKRYMPAWITRQGRRPGGVEVMERDAGTVIHMHNDQTWFPGDMTVRVQFALDRREKGIRKAMDAIIERRGKAAEKKQGAGGVKGG